MMGGHSHWSGLVQAAAGIAPGVAALLLLLLIRGWMNREHYRRREKRKTKV
jgi:hypothetical protein